MRNLIGDDMTGPILLVDDDPVQRRLLQAAVSKAGYETLIADDGGEALRALEGPRGPDIALMVLDLAMPGVDGLGVLQHMREQGITMPVVVQTAQGGIDTAVSAMRAGAFDFLVKPASPDRLTAAITSALKVGSMESAPRRGRKRSGGSLTFKDLVTRDAAMDRVLRLGQKAASSNIPILLEGESGVGKEVVARAIQGSGERRGKPFVTVNCGAIPEHLVESILFGHEKGSFTGATDKHTGKFVEADGGTLFLDEIGDLPLNVQVKLLRAVQDGEVDPVGARATVRVDIRLISATHRDLMQRVRDGKFREDLFYRLNVFPIFIPPLRDRPGDIPHLVDHFMARNIPAKSTVRTIAPSALALLKAYDWPGNVRQLENALFRAAVLCEGDMLAVEDFPQILAQVGHAGSGGSPAAGSSVDYRAPPPPSGEVVHTVDATSSAASGMGSGAGFGLVRFLDDHGNFRPLVDIEAEMIRLAIQHYGGQMSEVARRLGIGRSTLYRKLKEHGIEDADGSSASQI